MSLRRTRRASAPDPLPLNQRLATERTRLANERTLLAYTRTALALIAGGATLFLVDIPGAFWVAVVAILLGLVAGLVGLFRFVRVRRRITAAERMALATHAPADTD